MMVVDRLESIHVDFEVLECSRAIPFPLCRVVRSLELAIKLSCDKVDDTPINVDENSRCSCSTFLLMDSENLQCPVSKPDPSLATCRQASSTAAISCAAKTVARRYSSVFMLYEMSSGQTAVLRSTFCSPITAKASRNLLFKVGSSDLDVLGRICEAICFSGSREVFT